MIAVSESFTDFVPTQTIRPFAKSSAVAIIGSLILTVRAEKRSGRYLALLLSLLKLCWILHQVYFYKK